MSLARQTSCVWKRVTILCTACVFGFDCQKPQVRNDPHTTDRDLEHRHAAWSARQLRPAQQVVSQIEVLLAKEPCIGALNRWSRIYAYDEDMPNKTLYPGIVAFHLEAAGAFGVEPGLHVTEPNSWVRNDDTPIKMAWGDYEISTGKLTIEFCGNNVGPTTESTTIYRSDYYDDLNLRRAKQRERISTQIEP